MGASTSNVDEEANSGAKTNVPADGAPLDADDIYEKLLRGEVNTTDVMEEAWADDPVAQEEIRKIVDALNGCAGDPSQVAKQSKKLLEAAKAAEKKAQAVNTATEREASRQAEEWFAKQLKRSKAAEAIARAARENAEQESAKNYNNRLAEQMELLEQQRAKAESKARAMLLEEAQNARTAGSVRDGMLLPCKPPDPPADDCVPPCPKKNNKSKSLPEFYRLLGISFEATFDEVKKGYRKQALEWHPDKNQHRLKVAHERFQKINEAFDTLYDPSKREQYDAGKMQDRGRVKKLQGHGWSRLSDEDDDTLTVLGWKYKRQSWRNYVLMEGRIDDDPKNIVLDENDPRAPQEQIRVFWRRLGEEAYGARDLGEDANWPRQFIGTVWKDTPSEWPKAAQLQAMNEAAQQEWKERRMVYNRRRQKLLIAVELHEVYLALPDREEREKQRIGGLNLFRKDDQRTVMMLEQATGQGNRLI